jgi:hypothetical protein
MTLSLRQENYPALLDKVEQFIVAQSQVDCDIIHSFAPGIYMREAHMPADSTILGHCHKTEHLNLMMSGVMTMYHADGSTSLLKAPMMLAGKPGRKLAYMHTAVIWINIHATEERDVETLDRLLLEKTDHWEKVRKEYRKVSQEDRDDFNRVLTEIGMSAEIVRQLSETDDLIPFPYGSYKVKVSDSSIEGKGLFATARIKAQEPICLGRLAGKRTPAGRYINHGCHPNARMEALDNGDIMVVALRDISGSYGGHDGEEITVDYVDGLRTNLSTEKAA